jgi:hypothetical protein
MVFEIEDTKADFIEAWMYPRRRDRRAMSVFFCIVGIVCLWMGVRNLSSRDGNDTALLMSIGVGLSIVGISRSWSVRRSLAKLWLDHPIYRETKRYSFADNGFTSESYSGCSTMRWHAFSHWAETPHLFLIYFGPVISYYIPKRCVGSDVQLQEFRAFLQIAIGRTKYAPPVRAFPVEASAAVIAADEPQTTPPK